MIKKIASIRNFAVFEDFEWDQEVRSESGVVQCFQAINVIYGRNYSGKTTLSRIMRAMEIGQLSDKFEDPSFNVTFSDGTEVTQDTLTGHGTEVRVFNEDFVQENLRFITNADDGIEPFAILGGDNNKVERQIEELERELGSQEEGKETGLHATRAAAATAWQDASRAYKVAKDALDKQLSDKATSRKIGIRYHPARFGDQNYNIQKLHRDIEKAEDREYQPPADEELKEYDKLISETVLPSIPPFQAPILSLVSLTKEAKALVTKKVGESDKIDELLKDAVLNRWVNEGRALHKGKRSNCAFCGSVIPGDRWEKLEEHFDKESEKLESDIVALVARIEREKSTVSTALSIKRDHFYSRFQGKLDELDGELKEAIERYCDSLDALTAQLADRKDDILGLREFTRPDNTSSQLESVWGEYEVIRNESNGFSSSLGAEQTKARQALRLKEVSDYLITIRYAEQISALQSRKQQCEAADQAKRKVEDEICAKEELLASKKRELNDEEKGAKKVNEYLNNFFGHRFLSLEARESEPPGEEQKRIRFEVIRDGKKAYHLSEGERSLLAFCYFLAKLEDTETWDSRPIIWIDDPISSLDGNHIFFLFSLLRTEIVSKDKFEQLFVSTHNLEFLKYLKRLNGSYVGSDGKPNNYQKAYFVVARQDKNSVITVMPKYLKEYVTEFNYLFHQIYKCAAQEAINDTNYKVFYSFGNNARKFLEIYLYYRYPDHRPIEEKLGQFFGEDNVPAVLTDRINNEYSHLCGVFERGSLPVDVPEMQTVARQIIKRLKEDKEQYSALLKSVGEPLEDKVPA